MNKQRSFKRREFLRRSTGALGLGVAWQAAGGAGVAAETTGGLKPEAEMVLAELEEKAPLSLGVPRKDGQFLNLLVKLTRAARVLEVGTSQGYAALWIASALEETGGHLTTVEIRPERAKLAARHWTRAGLAHRVTGLEGNAHNMVPKLEGPFDFVFLDADKDGLMDYFIKLFPKKLAPGGMLVAHNAIRQKESMTDYLEMIGKHPQFDSVILSVTMDDGFAVSYRRRA